MLTIRDEQMKRFEEVALDTYVQKLIAHCRAFSPHLAKTLHDEELDHAIRVGIEDADSHGLRLRGPVRFYIDMMILLGSGFATDPQYPWVSEVLDERDDLAEMQRSDLLHERTVAYLRRVDGEDNRQTLDALQRLRALVRAGLGFTTDGLERELLGLMWQVHPHKTEATGDQALRTLIGQGVALARDKYGFRRPRSFGLMPTLMFAFGHEVDRDPLLPWIARTLDVIDPTDPDSTAERLERRAMVWLDGVLSNAKRGD